MTTRKEFHWFWAWQDDKEEAWLGENARQGWHLSRVDFPGFYTFESGDPGDMAYRLDFFTDHANKGSYLQLFQDAGWEYLGQMGSWQYFRKPIVNGEVPEIYTDNQSKIQKYQRLVGILVILMPIWIVLLTRKVAGESAFGFILTIVWFFVILFFTYAFLMLARRITQLRKK